MPPFWAGELFDEQDADGDELYEAVEAFILALRHDEEMCNPTLMSAYARVQKQSPRLLKAMGVLFLLTQLAATLFAQPLFFAAVFVVPALLFVFLRLLRLRIFREDWVCPHCGAQLPLKPKKFLPQPQHSACCPECGASLLDSSLIEKLRQDVLSEEEESSFKPVPELPPPPGNGLCMFTGVLFLLCDLPFIVITAVQAAQASPAALAIHVIDILLVAAAALPLFLCRAPKDERRPLFIVRE